MGLGERRRAPRITLGERSRAREADVERELLRLRAEPGVREHRQDRSRGILEAPQRRQLLAIHEAELELLRVRARQDLEVGDRIGVGLRLGGERRVLPAGREHEREQRHEHDRERDQQREAR